MGKFTFAENAKTDTTMKKIVLAIAAIALLSTGCSKIHCYRCQYSLTGDDQLEYCDNDTLSHYAANGTRMSWYSYISYANSNNLILTDNTGRRDTCKAFDKGN
jgi:hypothetical protein